MWINSHSKFEENWLKMLPAESENDALMDVQMGRQTDRQVEGWTLEHKFLNGGYNIIPRTF